MNKNIESSNGKKTHFIENLENISSRTVFFYFSIIGITGLIIRLVYFPYDLPIVADGQSYFWYAVDMSILGKFPENHVIVNNGWPTFLSVFFNFLNNENFLVFHNLQRFIGTIISLLTFIPIYFLVKKFVNKKYAIISCTLFVFEPKLILNSFLGTPESVYIFLISVMLWMFFSKKQYNIYISFFIIGLISLVRYEGILLVIPISIAYFIRFRKEKKNWKKFSICIVIFLLTIIPMSEIRNDTIGTDGLISHVSAGPTYVQKSIDNNQLNFYEFVFEGIRSSVVLLGWTQIPFLIIFVPLGILIIIKKIDYKILTLILTALTIFIPAFYAYSREFEEIKYLLPLYPIFFILIGFSIEKIYEKVRKEKIVLVSILCVVIITSVAYIDWKSIDYEHEVDAFQIMMDVSKFDMKINIDMGKNGKELGYIHWSKIYDNSNFPNLKSYFVFPNEISFLKDNTYKKELENYTDQKRFFKEYISINKKHGLTHIMIDSYNNKNNCGKICFDEKFNYIFFNENEFPYLEKVYDSKEKGYDYHVKLFKINYKEFENVI